MGRAMNEDSERLQHMDELRFLLTRSRRLKSKGFGTRLDRLLSTVRDPRERWIMNEMVIDHFAYQEHDPDDWLRGVAARADDAIEERLASVTPLRPRARKGLADRDDRDRAGTDNDDDDGRPSPRANAEKLNHAHHLTISTEVGDLIVPVDVEAFPVLDKAAKCASSKVRGLAERSMWNVPKYCDDLFHQPDAEWRVRIEVSQLARVTRHCDELWIAGLRVNGSDEVTAIRNLMRAERARVKRTGGKIGTLIIERGTPVETTSLLTASHRDLSQLIEGRWMARDEAYEYLMQHGFALPGFRGGRMFAGDWVIPRSRTTDDVKKTIYGTYSDSFWDEVQRRASKDVGYEVREYANLPDGFDQSELNEAIRRHAKEVERERRAEPSPDED
jgi:hypothetical protein